MKVNKFSGPCCRRDNDGDGDCDIHTACHVCGRQHGFRSTGLCDSCWEVERRLEDYLSHERGRTKAQALITFHEEQAKRKGKAAR